MDIEENSEIPLESTEDAEWLRLIANVDRYLETAKTEQKHQEELPKESEKLLREQENLTAKSDQLNAKPKILSGKVYPNDPCPCGSGRKYKKCCGRNAS